jgi:hypothetical protein
MSRLILVVSAALVYLGLAISPTTAMAADDPNILIMAEDADADGVARNSRISTRILNAVVTQLDQRRYRIYDETAVTIDTHRQGRTRRTDAELIDIAKSIRKPPIDVVVFFTVYANVDRKKYSNDLHLRIVGRLLSVHDGRRLGNWEEELPDRWSLPNRCFPDGKGVRRDCLLEAVGRDARRIATGMSSVLAERLEHLTDGGRRHGGNGRRDSNLEKGYSLTFEGFDRRDIREIEEYLTIFSGYIDHRPTTSMTKYVEFWYESTIRTSKLRRNLEKMMEVLALDYTIQFQGNKFSLRNKNIRRQGNRDLPGSGFKW